MVDNPPPQGPERASAPPAGGRLDPHAPKLSPDDPRLRFGRPTPRTLRAGPLVAIAAGLACAATFAAVLALEPPHPSHPDAPDAGPPAAPPIVPERIRNAPAPARLADAPDAAAWAADRRMGHGIQAGPEDLRRRADEEQDLRAKNAGVLFDVRGEGPRDIEAMRPSVPSTSAGVRTASPPPAGPEPDPSDADRKAAFLAGSGSPNEEHLPAVVEHPRSPYEVKAGTIIPAVLVTGINSDLPGPVIGQVRENVFDTVSGNHLLIPQGSRVLAHYNSLVAWGQERVLVCWNRLLFPNGDSVSLQCMPAADLQGAAGLTDEVDEHWMRILKGAAVATLLAATTTAVAGNTDGFNPTVPQVMARNASGEMNQVGQQLTRRNLTVQPTITVRPGFAVNVMVTKDMILAPYPEPALGAQR